MSFESWYRGYHATLLAALTVVAADRDLAADAAQETFVRALERWDRVGQMASPDGWAYRVGVNLLRRRKYRLGLERRLTSGHESAVDVDLRPEVWDAVRKLPRKQREAIALRYLMGLPEAEVAQSMGVAVAPPRRPCQQPEAAWRDC